MSLLYYIEEQTETFLGLEHDAGRIQIYVPVWLFCVVSMCFYHCATIEE